MDERHELVYRNLKTSLHTLTLILTNDDITIMKDCLEEVKSQLEFLNKTYYETLNVIVNQLCTTIDPLQNCDNALLEKTECTLQQDPMNIIESKFVAEEHLNFKAKLVCIPSDERISPKVCKPDFFDFYILKIIYIITYLAITLSNADGISLNLNFNKITINNIYINDVKSYIEFDNFDSINIQSEKR